MLKAGREHLTEAGMGYAAHLVRATRIGGALIGAGTACLVHGLLPGLFRTRATETIVRLNEEVKAGPQHGGATAQPMWLEFEI